MELNKTYSEYELNIIRSLDRYVSESSNGRLRAYVNEPILRNDDQGNGIWLQPDLTVRDTKANNKLVEVYEICSYTSYKVNLNTLRKDLLDLEKYTGAKAFLAFMQDDKGLQILSLEQVDDEIKRRNPQIEEPIKTFSDFYDKVNRVYKSKYNKKNKLFFRGHSWNFDPIPGVYRNDNYLKERIIYEEAVRRKPSEFTPNMTVFDNLVKMQHYGLPTRLLDITSNPLVALYFACEKNNKDDEKFGKQDGKVFVYSMRQDEIRYFDSHNVTNLSHLAKLQPDFNFDIKKHEKYLKDIIKEEKAGLDGKRLTLNSINQVVCVLPKLNNDRIIRQEGAFLLFGMGKTKDKMAELKHKPIEITIDKDAKLGILEELNHLGINEASLFPETDKVMQQIKRDFLL